MTQISLDLTLDIGAAEPLFVVITKGKGGKVKAAQTGQGDGLYCEEVARQDPLGL